MAFWNDQKIALLILKLWKNVLILLSCWLLTGIRKETGEHQTKCVCFQGVEICYEVYNPRIQKIEVLKLEKRLDDNLMYLRDALPEYSIVDPEMKTVPFSPTGEVPLNSVSGLFRLVWQIIPALI